MSYSPTIGTTNLNFIQHVASAYLQPTAAQFLKYIINIKFACKVKGDTKCIIICEMPMFFIMLCDVILLCGSHEK